MATIHNTVFPDTEHCPDLETYKNLYKEYYERNAPLLEVKPLNKKECRKDDFYGDTRVPEDRDYSQRYHVHIFGPLDQYTYDLTYWGIDAKRPLTLFSVCVPELEDLGLTLKVGDYISYDGVDHEILTIKRNEEAYYVQSNYCFELLLATYIPNTGS